MTKIRLFVVVMLLIAAAYHQARAAQLATGADFVRRCLAEQAPAWTVEDACNRTARHAWVFVPHGVQYSHCGSTALPALRRQVITAYARHNPYGLRRVTQEEMILAALISAFGCRPEFAL